MLLETILVAVLTVDTLSTHDLETYYWDCDTAYMQGTLGGQDLMSCLAITEEFQQRRFNSNRRDFMQYWNEHKLEEWARRGLKSV
jgi:hypothetical protein